MNCSVCLRHVPWPHARHDSCTPRDLWVRCDTCGRDLPGVVALIHHHTDVNGRGTPCQMLTARRAGRVVALGAWRGAS